MSGGHFNSKGQWHDPGQSVLCSEGPLRHYLTPSTDCLMCLGGQWNLTKVHHRPQTMKANAPHSTHHARTHIRTVSHTTDHLKTKLPFICFRLVDLGFILCGHL